MLINAQINNYKITKQVGSGAFGLVYHCVDLTTNKEFAVKAILKQQNLPKDMLQMNPNNANSKASNVKKSNVLQQQLYHFFKSYANKVFLPSINLDSLMNMPLEQLSSENNYYKEIILHLRSNHLSNVVKIFEILESSIAIFTVMEYFPMDLFTSIVDEQHFAHNPLLIKKVFIQLAGLLKKLADIDIYHCDIKPENILLDSNDNVKLCDFGLATDKLFLNMDTCVGSSYYMAPERVSGSGEIIRDCVLNCKVNDRLKVMMSLSNLNQYPTTAGDVWSLSIILMNLLTTRNPWLKATPTDATFSHFINNKKVLSKILDLSDDMLELLIGTEAMGENYKHNYNNLTDFANDPLAGVKLHGIMSLNPWERGDSEVLEYFISRVAKAEQFLRDSQDQNTNKTLKGGRLGICRKLEDYEIDEILERRSNFNNLPFSTQQQQQQEILEEEDPDNLMNFNGITNNNSNLNNPYFQQNKLSYENLMDQFYKNMSSKSGTNLLQHQQINTLVNTRENTMKTLSSTGSTVSQSNNLFDNQQTNYLNFKSGFEQISEQNNNNSNSNNNNGHDFSFFDLGLENEAFEASKLNDNINFFLNKFKSDDFDSNMDMLMEDSTM